MTFSPLHASLLALAVLAAPGAALATPAGTQPPIVLAQADTASETQDVEAVRKFLARTEDVSQLDEEKLRQRLKRAQRLSKQEGLPSDLQSALQERIAALQSELAKRGQASAAAPSAPAAAEETSAAGAGDVAAFLNSVRPAAELSEKELRRQVKRAAQLAKTEGLPKEQRKALHKVVKEGRAKLKGEAAGSGSSGADAEQTAEQTPGQTAEQPPQGKVNPALEQQAQAMLKDNADVRAMKQPELRVRLTGMRDLLASGELSPATEEALRAKLANERQVLRNQVSASGSSSASHTSSPRKLSRSR